MFFPDTKDPFALPVAPLLIFNASWPAEECSTSGPDYDKYNDFCGNLVSKVKNRMLHTVVDIYCLLVWKVLQHSFPERPQHQEEES